MGGSVIMHALSNLQSSIVSTVTCTWLFRGAHVARTKLRAYLFPAIDPMHTSESFLSWETRSSELEIFIRKSLFFSHATHMLVIPRTKSVFNVTTYFHLCRASQRPTQPCSRFEQHVVGAVNEHWRVRAYYQNIILAQTVTLCRFALNVLRRAYVSHAPSNCDLPKSNLDARNVIRCKEYTQPIVWLWYIASIYGSIHRLLKSQNSRQYICALVVLINFYLRLSEWYRGTWNPAFFYRNQNPFRQTQLVFMCQNQTQFLNQSIDCIKN